MAVAPSPLRLSARVSRLQPSSTLAVSARVKDLRRAGKDIIGFGAGEPDFDTPQAIKQAAVDALRAGETGYQPVAGTLEARQAVAEKLATENGIECTADDIVITVGAKHAIYLALQALIDPQQQQQQQQQQVVLPTPAWVSYRPMIELCGGRVVEVPGAVANDFKITPEQLEQSITEHTAAVVINSPSNPCGTMYSPEELKELGAVLMRHEQVAVIADEIYEKLIYGGFDHLSLGSIDALADRVITINGLSKAYAMTGWRIGYACAPSGSRGGTNIAAAIARLQSQMTSHPASFFYPAIIEALTTQQEEVERMRCAFARRAEVLHRHVLAMPGIECPKPTGAFYVFPRVSAHFGRQSPGGRRIDSALTFAEALLEEALVAVVPGDDFGRCAAGHVRMSFACSEEHIEEGCRRMHEWLSKINGGSSGVVSSQ